MIADGETIVSALHHLDRGYEGFVVKLQSLGADVEESLQPTEAVVDRMTQPSGSQRASADQGERGRATLDSPKREPLATIASLLDRRPRPSRDPAVQKTRLLETIRALGCVQLDTISVVSRSHETVLWSRLGAYDPVNFCVAALPRNGLLTEYWAHAAAIIPIETFPYFREAMDAYREKYERPGSWAAHQSGDCRSRAGRASATTGAHGLAPLRTP